MYKKILVISPIPSHPQDAGNRARIYNILIALQKFGHDVHFLHIEKETKDNDLMRQAWGDKFYSLPYTKQLNYKKLSLTARIFRKLRCFLTQYPTYPGAVDDWYENFVSQFLAKLHRKVKFDVVIVEYIFFSKALEVFDKSILKIIDTHDVFANRAKLYQDKGQEYYWYSTTEKEETKALRRADLIIAIQKEEEVYFKKLVGDDKVITVGHTVPLRKAKQLSQIRRKILYIASENETNIHAINYFIRKVFPEVRAKLSDVQLLIAGKICEVVEETDGCVKFGYVDNLEKIYDTTDVVINPILFGTGLKIKSIEALGQSKVLVTTVEGARGLEIEANKAFLVANNTEEFAQHIIEVMMNLCLASTLSEKAYLFAEQYNKEVFKPLEQILKNNK